MVKKNNPSDHAVESQFPEVKNDQTAISVKRFENGDPATGGIQFTNSLLQKQLQRLQVLEEQCVKAAGDGVIPITFKSSIPMEGRNQFTVNTYPLTADVTDRNS